MHQYWQSLRWALRQRHVDVDVPLHLYPALTSTGVLSTVVHDEVGFPLSSYMDGASPFPAHEPRVEVLTSGVDPRLLQTTSSRTRAPFTRRRWTRS